MAEQRVLRMGDPELRRVSDPVSRFDDSLADLIRDMWDTMAARGGVGIAAPQIGVPLRVVVFEVANSERYPEGCLSVPGLRGVVPRRRRLRYRGLDAEGRPFEREAEDFHARVIQHECDHLDGILYPQRMEDLSTLAFEDELNLVQRLAEVTVEV